MTWNTRQIDGASDDALLARIRELAAKENRDWSDSMELSRLRAKAQERGLDHA